MGFLKLFSSKEKVTTDVKNEVNGLFNHLSKAEDKLYMTDKVSAYIAAMEDWARTAIKLEHYEQSYDWIHGKYRWPDSVQKLVKDFDKKKSKVERRFVDRAYERLERDCLKLTTEASKTKKRTQFFTELEHYYTYFNEETVDYIKSLHS